MFFVVAPFHQMEILILTCLISQETLECGSSSTMLLERLKDHTSGVLAHQQQIVHTVHAVPVLYVAAGQFLKHTINSQIDFLLSRQPLVSINLNDIKKSTHRDLKDACYSIIGSIWKLLCVVAESSDIFESSPFQGFKDVQGCSDIRETKSLSLASTKRHKMSKNGGYEKTNVNLAISCIKKFVVQQFSLTFLLLETA